MMDPWTEVQPGVWPYPLFVQPSVMKFECPTAPLPTISLSQTLQSFSKPNLVTYPLDILAAASNY